MLGTMDEVRLCRTRERFEIPSLIQAETEIDIGLIDIPVFFRGDLDLVASYMRHRPGELFEENLRHIDRLFAGTFHDQMPLASVLHAVKRDGSPEIHYHNLVFGVRREFRSRDVLVGPLDFRPMMSALGKELRIGVMGPSTDGWKVAYG